MVVKRKIVRKPVRTVKKPVGKTVARPPKANRPSNVATKPGGAFGRARTEKKLNDLRRSTPFNLSIPVGGEASVYILDKGEPFYRYEHQVGASKTSRGRTFPCIQDGVEPCPLCASENRTGTYVMYLTCVVPIDKYVKQDGTKVVRRYQKKLFPIKVKMSAKYERIFKKYGSFRGLVLKLNRDGQMDPGTGNDVEVVRKLSEADIAKFAKGLGIKGIDAETKDYLIKSKIDEPFDYDKIFPRPTATELAAMAQVPASEGGGLGSSDFDDSDDGFGDAGWGE